VDCFNFKPNSQTEIELLRYDRLWISIGLQVVRAGLDQGSRKEGQRYPKRSSRTLPIPRGWVG
jgi:hypothetical protein